MERREVHYRDFMRDWADTEVTDDVSKVTCCICLANLDDEQPDTPDYSKTSIAAG